MAWTYEPDDLDTTTSLGRLYTVRLLVGDTDSTAQQMSDEEINFALSQNSDRVYSAAVYICRVLAAKYTRKVDTQLDGALEAKYSTLARQYNLLATQLAQLGRTASGGALGVSGGGISVVAVELADANTDRVKPAFNKDQFKNDEAGYIPEYN